MKFLKEKLTLRIEPFQKLTRWIELSVLHDPKNWTFFSYITQRIGLFLIFKPFSTISLKNDWPCFEHDSKNWAFLFKMTQRIEHMTWLKVLIELLKNITHRIECFLNMTHRIEPLFFNMTPRIEPFCQYWFFIKKN